MHAHMHRFHHSHQRPCHDPLRSFGMTTFAPGAGRAEHPPLSLLPTLRTIPLLAQHAAVVPFVVRALQPLLSPGELHGLPQGAELG